MIQPTLDAGRLTLVPAVRADLDALWEIWSDPDVRRYLFDDQPVERERAAEVLAGCLAEAANGLGLWTVRERGADAVIGCVGLMPITWAAYDPTGAGLVEPIVALAPAVWHRGHAVAALRRLVAYGFDTLGLARIAGATDVPNEASHRMLTRAGFVPQRECPGPYYRMRTYLLERPAAQDALQHGGLAGGGATAAHGGDAGRGRRLIVAPSLPTPHAAFLEEAIPRLAADARLVGVAAGGSYLTETLDEFSDLDLVIGVAPDAYENVLAERQSIAALLGPLLVAFTGEHVGEPRLLICLYGPPLLHVDLKFVREDHLSVRVEDPVVLWEREGRMRAALANSVARFPDPDPQWIEDRFWVWVHYVAGKVGRGEILEAADALASIRGLTFGPLALASRGARPTGVRKLEQAAPDLAARVAATVAPYDGRGCLAALERAIALYRELRNDAGPDLRCHARAEAAVVAYTRQLAERLA